MMKIKKLRLFVQIFFFVFLVLVVLNHQLEESGSSIPLIPSISLHAICPFGGVETASTLLLYGSYIPKLHQSTLVIFALVFLSSILFGPILCGYICPLGSIQEWIGKIGRKLFKKKYNHFVPEKLDKSLRYLRYISLIAVVYLTGKTLTLIFLDVDPYYALMNFYTGEVAIGALITLTVTLLLSLFVERPWCKYACPYGALLGLTNLIRLFSIKRKEATCVNCHLCDNVCPMNIEVSKKQSIRDHQCISCHECTSDEHCPIPETVMIESIFKKEVK
ncbi:MAG: 4Fe-4S binding protein [Clostridiales bacterium]|nr:4Fe-4S binding protein [Clostridiales bacterium]